MIQTTKLNFFGPYQKIDYSSPKEISKIITDLPIKKAPGHDNINNITLKKLPPSAIAYLNNIFNSCFRIGYFPHKWKHATIIPIVKPNKTPTIPESYRPISLLTTFSKIFEKIILKRLKKHLHAINAIPREQFGFTERISTQHQLLRISELIYTAFQKNITPLPYLLISHKLLTEHGTKLSYIN